MPHPGTDDSRVRHVRRMLRRDRGEDGMGLIEVVIAIALILSSSVLSLTAVTSGFRDDDVGSQRLQASQLLATELRTGGCGSVTTVTELGTTYHVTVTPSTCAAGTTDTGTATWSSNGQSFKLSIESVTSPSTGTASAYSVTT
jgi:Tfp pilus assembly protein PilV